MKRDRLVMGPRMARRAMRASCGGARDAESIQAPSAGSRATCMPRAGRRLDTVAPSAPSAGSRATCMPRAGRRLDTVAPSAPSAGSRATCVPRAGRRLDTVAPSAVLLTVLLLSAGSPAGVARAQGEPPMSDLPDGITYVTSVEGIHEYRLENGLQILLFPDPSVQTATVNITYFVGSLHEGYGETGMAHLLEHMVFKGTPNHPDIPNELTARGCRPNGSTWFDRTNYFETFAATQENLAWALELEADRMVNSFIAAEDLESEMTVVRNEFEAGENNPRGILEERIYSTAFLWHNYGNTTIGARSDIENVPIERLQAFYRTWYRPDNAMLVVAGRIDMARTLELIKEKYGPLAPPEVPVPQLYTQEPAQDGERTVTLRRVGDVQVVGVAYHIPAGPHPQYPALAILAHVLGNTPSGRLHKALIETQMATSVRASADRFRDPGLLYISAEVREGKSLEQARDEILRVTESLASSPPTEEEVERARADMMRRWESRMRNSSWAAINMSEWAAMGDWRLLFVHRDRLQEVTPADVKVAAAEYLKAANRTVGLFVPTDAPERVTVAQTPPLEEMIRADLGGEGLAAGEEFDPSPKNIEANVLRTQLPSGLKLVVLPKATRGEKVNVSLRLHFGNLDALMGKAVAGEMAARMLMRGTTSRTRQQIDDELALLQSDLRIYGWASGLSASIETTREKLPDVLRLLGDVLRNPAFPENEFEQLREQMLARLEDAKSNPHRLAFAQLMRHLKPYPQDDVRYTLTPEEEIERVRHVTLDDVRAFHRDFYGASAGELAVAGACEPEELIGLATELLGTWECRTPYERIAETFAERPPILESIETPDKESAVFSAGLRIELCSDDADYPAMVLANFMTGGGFLNSRLATRIRRTEGLSYGVGSRLSASDWDRDGSFGAYAIYAPQNDARLLNAFREEIQRVLDNGFTAEEVEAAKSGWLQRQTVSRSQDRELVRTLVDREERGHTMLWDAELEKRVAELTPEQTHETFRRYVDLEKISIVRAGDFANADEPEAELHEAAERGGPRGDRTAGREGRERSSGR